MNEACLGLRSASTSQGLRVTQGWGYVLRGPLATEQSCPLMPKMEP